MNYKDKYLKYKIKYLIAKQKKLIGGVDFKDYYFLSSKEKLNTINFIKNFMKHRKKSSEERKKLSEEKELLKLKPLPSPQLPIKSKTSEKREITDSDSDSDSEKKLSYSTPLTNPPPTPFLTPIGDNMPKHKDRKRHRQRRLREQAIVNKDVIKHNNSEQKK